MIPNVEKECWHYLAVKKLFALLRGKSSKHDSNFYFFNCFHFLKTESKLKFHEKVCENKKSVWNCNAIPKG